MLEESLHLWGSGTTSRTQDKEGDLLPPCGDHGCIRRALPGMERTKGPARSSRPSGTLSDSAGLDPGPLTTSTLRARSCWRTSLCRRPSTSTRTLRSQPVTGRRRRRRNQSRGLEQPLCLRGLVRFPSMKNQAPSDSTTLSEVTSSHWAIL